MKILSKYKDYYDYLIGIYGQDEKIVLDRRIFDSPYIPTTGIIEVFICGYIYDVYSLNGQLYIGEELLKIGAVVDRSTKRFRYFGKRKSDFTVSIENTMIRYPDEVSVIPYKDIESNNEKENCPILIRAFGYQKNKWIKYPKLSDLKLQKVLSPNEIFLMLSEWLAKKDDVVDNRTDKEKILTNGFDLKTSFRNV